MSIISGTGHLSENLPTNIRLLLQDTVENFKTVLGANLVGVYVHGSIALGSFNPTTSDIDLLIVSNEKIPIATKRQIISFLLKLSNKAPAKGFEISVVTLGQLQNFQYPTPFELHYSNTWKDAYAKGEVDYNELKYDPDLAAHFAITRSRGIGLFGKPIREIFPVIPEEYYLRSILADAQDILTNIARDPVYGVLNLCRVLAYLRDKTIMSKLEGGKWALKHLNQQYAPLIQQAIHQYQAESSGSRPWNKDQLNAFVEFMKKQIEQQKNTPKRFHTSSNKP